MFSVVHFRNPQKVDKKYIYQHGLNPPLKNCRRRRFRKTLKKKSVEAPEIEKEVKNPEEHLFPVIDFLPSRSQS